MKKEDPRRITAGIDNTAQASLELLAGRENKDLFGEDPGEIVPALRRAVRAVKKEKRQALLKGICKHP